MENVRTKVEMAKDSTSPRRFRAPEQLQHPTAECELRYCHLSGDAYLLSVGDFGR